MKHVDDAYNGVTSYNVALDLLSNNLCFVYCCLPNGSTCEEGEQKIK